MVKVWWDSIYRTSPGLSRVDAWPHCASDHPSKPWSRQIGRVRRSAPVHVIRVSDGEPARRLQGASRKLRTMVPLLMSWSTHISG